MFENENGKHIDYIPGFN